MTMRITVISVDTRERIEIEGAEWPTYYRYSPDNWRALMGQSEEPLYFECEELEELYQRSKK